MLLKLLDSHWALLKKGEGKLQRNAQRLLESLWAILKQYKKVVEKCPNIRHQPIVGNFCSFPPKRCISVYINNKSKTHWKYIKTFRGSYPDYFLSHHTTFSHTNWSDSPFKARSNFFRFLGE
jgi:hypothetical protein